MKIFDMAAKWLFILCLPILLVTASIGWAVNSLWLYQYGFNKYEVSTIGLTETELEKVAAGLISYFNSGEEFINLTVKKDGKPFELFNEREVIHLKDVKKLIWLDYRVLMGTLLYALGYAVSSFSRGKRQQRRQLAWGMVGGSSLTLALMLGLGLGAWLGFDQLFLQFHLISFSNELWQLDPAKDYLIRLFPQGFWRDATLFSALGTVVAAIVFGTLGGWYLSLTKRRERASW